MVLWRRDKSIAGSESQLGMLSMPYHYALSN